MHDVVEIHFDHGLVLVLDALGVKWQMGRPPNGSQGTVMVAMDGETDGRLEDLINNLADLRWKYDPGRSLQLVMDLGIDAQGVGDGAQ
jgi:hypothetical protein